MLLLFFPKLRHSKIHVMGNLLLIEFSVYKDIRLLWHSEKNWEKFKEVSGWILISDVSANISIDRFSVISQKWHSWPLLPDVKKHVVAMKLKLHRCFVFFQHTFDIETEKQILLCLTFYYNFVVASRKLASELRVNIINIHYVSNIVW